MTPRRAIIIAVVGFVGLFVIIMLANSIKWNPVGRMKTVQYLDGSIGFFNKQGFYPSMFGTVNDWPQVSSVSIGSYEGGKDDAKEADVDAIAVSFRGSATAHQSLLVRIDLPTDKTTLVDILRMFPGGYENFLRKGILPEIEMATRTAANLMEAEEALNNLSSYKDLIQDQLTFGLYKLQSHIEIDTNDAKEIERKNVVKIVMDDKGMKERIPLDLKKLGAVIRSVQCSRPDFDASVQTAIDARRNASLAAETAKKNRIAAEQQKLSAVAEGEKAVIEAQYAVQKEQAAVVAKARIDKEASDLDVQTAGNEKTAAILRAEGDAKSKQLVMQADNYREKQMQMEIRKTELICDAIKTSQMRFVPEISISGDGKGASADQSVRNLINMLNVSTAQGLQSK
jgi:hypothetical protein